MKVCCLLLVLCCALMAHAVPADPLAKGLVLVPASDFLDEIPKGNTITEAAVLQTPWLYNNTAIVLKSATNLMTQVNIPEDGTWYLFVRSQGEKGSSFKVAINDQVTDSVFGRRALNWA